MAAPWAPGQATVRMGFLDRLEKKTGDKKFKSFLVKSDALAHGSPDLRGTLALCLGWWCGG